MATTTTTTTRKTTTTTTTTRKGKPAGYVLYRGPSLIDGSPIVVVATLKTDNAKTGDMVQTWILRDDMLPTEAMKTGADHAICGACPLRGVATNGVAKGRSCYVNVGNAPQGIYKAMQRGNYPVATRAIVSRVFRGKLVRLGAYGDPLAVPFQVWDDVVKASSGHTGYTHQWRMPHASAYRHLVMASCETERGVAIAQDMGWRTFRVRRADDAVMPNEIVCPASDEAGNRRECATCLACDGADRPGKRSIVIIGHGGLVASANVNRTLERLASE
jgi:hypothetical protein